MKTAGTVWQKPELMAVVRDSKPHALDAIWGGNDLPEDGSVKCPGPPKKYDCVGG